jgi:hypothetical protein
MENVFRHFSNASEILGIVGFVFFVFLLGGKEFNQSIAIQWTLLGGQSCTERVVKATPLPWLPSWLLAMTRSVRRAAFSI